MTAKDRRNQKRKRVENRDNKGETMRRWRQAYYEERRAAQVASSMATLGIMPALISTRNKGY